MAKHKDKTPDKSKSKKENKEEEVENNGVGETESKDVRPDYDILKHRVNVISNPLASRKLTSKLYKTVKKGIKYEVINVLLSFMDCVMLISFRSYCLAFD